MTSTLEHEIAAYLRSQAQRVEVTDELDAIENDLLLPRGSASNCVTDGSHPCSGSLPPC